MHHAGFTVPAILQRTLTLISDNASRGLAVLILLAGLAVVVDSGLAGPGLEFALSALTSVVQYWVTVSLLDRLELRFSTKPRFPAFFLAGILTSLGAIAGLILLVVPGVVLMVRWSISVPAVVATDGRAFEAIGYSWRETAESFWPILVAFLVVYAPVLLGIGALFLAELGLEMGLATTIMFDLLFYIGLIAGWHMAVAIYAMTLDSARVSEVFA